MDKPSLVAYFEAHHVTFKEDWLNDAVMFCKDLGKANTAAQLRSCIWEMFLYSDLTDSYKSPMKIPAAAVKMVITKPIVFQIVSVLNIARSVYDQFRERTEKDDDLSWFNGETDETCKSTAEPSEHQSNGRRMLKLKLFDGCNQMMGIEFGGLHEIPLDVLPGAKILLTSRVLCRRGIMLLNDSNVQLLGGEVESLCDNFDRTMNLAEMIGVKFEKGKRKVTNSTTRTPIDFPADNSRADSVATISPFLVRLPREKRPSAVPQLAAVKKEVEVVDSSSFPDVIPETPCPSEPKKDGGKQKKPAEIPIRPMGGTRNANGISSQRPPAPREIIPTKPIMASKQKTLGSVINPISLPVAHVNPSSSNKCSVPAVSYAQTARNINNTQQRTQAVTAQPKVRDPPDDDIIPQCEIQRAIRQKTPDLPIKGGRLKVVPHAAPPLRRKSSHGRKHRREEGKSRSISEFFQRRMSRHAAVNKTIRSPMKEERMHRVAPNTWERRDTFRAADEESRDGDVELSSPNRNTSPFSDVIECEVEDRNSRRREFNRLPEQSRVSDVRPKPPAIYPTSSFSSTVNIDCRPNAVHISPERKSGDDDFFSACDSTIDLFEGGLNATLNPLSTPELLGRPPSPRPPSPKPEKVQEEVRPIQETSTDRRKGHTEERQEREVEKSLEPKPASHADSTGAGGDVVAVPPKRSRMEVQPRNANLRLDETFDHRNANMLGRVFEKSPARRQAQPPTLGPQIQSVEYARHLSMVDRFNQIGVLSLRDVLKNKRYWMLPKVVPFQAVCTVPNSLRTKDGQWAMPICIADESMSQVFCETSPVLLERMLGFTVQSCQDPQVTRNNGEMERRKSRALWVAQSFRRLDLIVFVEMYPADNSTGIIVNVRSLGDILHLQTGS